MYFEIVKTGRIVTDRDIKLAYEICTGHTFNFEHDDANYRRWVNLCPIRRIPDSEITVEKLILGNAFASAVILYKRQHNCTLKEARDACIKLCADRK